MSKNSKKPKYRQEPNPTKNAQTLNNPDDNFKRRASWHISSLETEGDYGWHSVSLEDFEFIQARLSSFESMTWDEIFIQGKKQNHSCSINKLSPDAQKRLEAIGMDDIDCLHSLRLGATQRIWGVFAGGYLNLLWWDPDHQVYPCKKKHT
jgi:hypothetical protein